MSTLNKTGLRLAAAGAAAALALAAGAPAFAQPELEPETGNTETDQNTEPAEPAETGETGETGANTEPATEGEDTEAEEGAGDGSEVEDEKDPAAEEEIPAEELPVTEEEDEDWEEVYSYAYMDDVLEGANVGESVLAEPQFRIDGESLVEAPAATVLVFTDSTSLESIFVDEEWELTYHAYANAPYDNCLTEEWGVICVTEFQAEVGKSYELSAESPLYYDIVDQVDEDDAAAYYAWDIDAAELDEWLASGYSLEGDNQLSLVETDPIDTAFYNDFGLFYFQADLVLPNLPGTEDPSLPSTGNSSIVLISSAAAALLAGAVVFFVLRRRTTAANWE